MGQRFIVESEHRENIPVFRFGVSPLGVGLLMFATLVPRLAFAIRTSPGFNEFGVIGQNLVTGRGFSLFQYVDGRVIAGTLDTVGGRPIPGSYMPPGFTYLVAGAMRLSNSLESAGRLLQALNITCALIALLLLMRLAWKISNRGSIVILTGLGFALLPTSVFQASQVSAANIYLPLFLGMILCTANCVQSGKRSAAAWLGVVSGCYGLLRAEAIVVLGAAVIVVLVAARDQPFRRRVGTVVIAAAIASGTVTPWLVRNSIVMHTPTVTLVTTGPFNLWIGNHDGATGSQKQLVDTVEPAAELLPPSDRYELDRASLYLDETRTYISDKPIAFLSGLARKAVLLTVGDFHDERYSIVLVGAPALLIFGLGIVGLSHQRDPFGQSAIGVLLASAVPLVAFFVLERYRVQIAIGLLPWAASELDRQLRCLRRFAQATRRSAS